MNAAGEDMLLTDRSDDVLTVTLNRPEVHNALHPGQLESLLKLIGRAAGDTDLRLLAIRGAGQKAFSAGFDIKALSEADPEGPPSSEVLFDVTAALIGCPVPTLAVIHGHCIGAGLDLAMSCDHRIAAPGSQFSLPAAKLGTIYRPRSLERFESILGGPTSKRLAVCGHKFDAAQGLRTGLLDEIVEPSRLAEVTREWVSGGAGVARSHKRILDSVGETPDRGEAFWGPLDDLRRRSVESEGRARAISDFVDSSDSGDLP